MLSEFDVLNIRTDSAVARFPHLVQPLSVDDPIDLKELIRSVNEAALACTAFLLPEAHNCENYVGVSSE
jgi:hypothetical protein